MRVMAENVDTPVLGSQSAALTLFTQNAADCAKRPELAAQSAYWFALAALAAKSGNHQYPSA